MRVETQRTISAWATGTFGKASRQVIVDRAQEEMRELTEAVREGQPVADIAEEAADVAIVLLHLAQDLGIDLNSAIDAKMAKNRKRKWVVDGNGRGRHVK